MDLRKELRMTQQQLADELGKPQSYVAKVEGCERKLDILELMDWCKALGKTASEYIQEIEYYPPKATNTHNTFQTNLK